MTTRRLLPRAKTTPVPTLHSLLTSQEAENAITRRSTDQYLLKYDDLPPWRRDNHYILTHYRPVTYSYYGCFQSLFYLHNESVNIHSHLLGAFLFFFVSFSVYAFENHARNAVKISDILAFSCFFSGAVTCLGISAWYHTISNHSPWVNQLGNQIDYVGIVALITGSCVPSIYYGFYCDPLLQMVYWTMISCIGIGCTIVSVNPNFRTPAWRNFRAGMFIAFGLSAAFPIFHGTSLYGVHHMNQSIGLSWAVLQGFLYIFGAIIYAARVPERFQPGKFDVWGSSHQIFHILILLAAMSQLMGLLTAFHHASTHSTC